MRAESTLHMLPAPDLSQASHQSVVDNAFEALTRLGAYEQVFDIVPFGVIYVEPAGHVIVSSRAFNEYLLRPPLAVNGLKLEELIVALDLPITIPVFERFVVNGVNLQRPFVNRYLTADPDQWARLEWSPLTSPIGTQGENGVVGVCRLLGYESPGTPL